MTRPLVLTLHLDARLLADARQGLLAGVLEARVERQGQDRQAATGASATLDELRARPRGDAGHEREVVVRTAAGAAHDLPATDAAVLHGLRVRGRRGRVVRPGRWGAGREAAARKAALTMRTYAR